MGCAVDGHPARRLAGRVRVNIWIKCISIRSTMPFEF